MARKIDAGTVYVTGGSGHLGANLVRRLLQEGAKVRALVRPQSNNEALDGLPIEIVEGDLRDQASLERTMKGCSTVFHCAAFLSTAECSDEEKLEIFETNVVGTQKLLRVAQSLGIVRVVVTGSLSATGYDPKNPSRAASEDWPFFPFAETMPYEMSKMLVEHECLRAFADGMDVVVATSCAILGPNDYKPSRMGRVLCDFAQKKMPAYIPGGFEFVTTTDIVEGHMLAMEKGRAGQKYIFSSRFMTVDELMDVFAEVTGKPKPKFRLSPGFMGAVASVAHPVQSKLFPNKPQRFTPGAVRILSLQRHADTSKAREELGFEPTPVIDALRAAYQDFQRRGLLKGDGSGVSGDRRDSGVFPQQPSGQSGEAQQGSGTNPVDARSPREQPSSFAG